MAGGASSPATAYDEGGIVALANDARAAQGLGGLVRNASLDAVALGWAERMAADGSIGHNPAAGQQIPAGWRSWGENVASGYPGGAAVHEGWMNSPGHRANILGDFTDIGVALIEAAGTTWAVQVFATYPGRGPVAPAPPPPPPAEPAAPAPAAPAPAPAPAAPAAPAPAASAPAPPPAPDAAPSDTSWSATPPPTPSPAASVVPRATAAGEAAAYRAPADPAPWDPGIALFVLVAGVAATLLILRVRRGI